MLEVKNMVKTFFKGTINEKTALQGIDLRLEEGDFCTVIGGNGAGKSTLLNSIAGVFPVDEGSITINDIDVTKMPEYKRAKYIGRVFQDPMVGTAGNMQIEENLILAMRRGKSLGLKWAFKDSEQAFFKERLALLGLGLEDRLSARMGLLSGGQRQRLAIASVLATNPTVLVLDEPTSSLDPDGTAELYRLVGDLNKKHGITVVVIDHDLHAVLPYANRMALMVNGSIACDDDVPTTLRYMYEHNIHVDALPSVFTTYMELEQAGFHSDEPWLSIESAIKGLHQIEMAHAIQTEVYGESNSTNNQTNTTVVEDRKPIQRVDDVPGKDGGAHA